MLLPFARSILAGDTTVRLGNTQMSIPSPDGFALVTTNMTRLDPFMDGFVGPDNVRLVNFIPEEFVSKALHDEVPELVRYTSLQSYKKSVAATMTTADFNELKSSVRKQYSETFHKIEKQMPDLMNKVNKRLEGQLDAPLNLKINQTVPLPPHHEGERDLALSLMMNLAVKSPDGQVTNGAVAMTTTFLHVRGKLLFAYVYGGGNDLEWTRQVSRDWSAAILAANPSDTATAASEAASSGSAGNVINGVVRGAVIGGAIGGLIALFRRGKKPKPPE